MSLYEYRNSVPVQTLEKIDIKSEKAENRIQQQLDAVDGLFNLLSTEEALEFEEAMKERVTLKERI